MIRLRIFMQIYISVRIMKRTALRQRLVSPVKYPNKYSVLWYFIYFYVLRAFHTRLPSQKHKDAQFTDDIFHIFFYILVPIGYFIHAFRARYAFASSHSAQKHKNQQHPNNISTAPLIKLFFTRFGFDFLKQTAYIYVYFETCISYICHVRFAFSLSMETQVLRDLEQTRSRVQSKERRQNAGQSIEGWCYLPRSEIRIPRFRRDNRTLL